MKNLKYIFEYIALLAFYGFCKALPLDTASDFGGWLGRSFGPKLGVSKRVRDNMREHLPALSEQEREQAFMDMWDNLGRTLAEYPHLQKIARERVTFENVDIYERSKSETVIFACAHQCNWEVSAAAFNTHFGRVDVTYRPPNNPHVDRLLMHARTVGGLFETFPKSREGGRKILSTLKAGGHVGFMIDQKYNEGIPVRFFEKDAMTNPVFAQMAQRYKCLLIPSQIRRTKGANFVMRAHAPIPTHHEDESPRPLAEIIRDTHIHLEDWIRATPAQWLWVHKRWASKKLSEATQKDAA